MYFSYVYWSVANKVSKFHMARVVINLGHKSSTVTFKVDMPKRNLIISFQFWLKDVQDVVNRQWYHMVTVAKATEFKFCNTIKPTLDISLQNDIAFGKRHFILIRDMSPIQSLGVRTNSDNTIICVVINSLYFMWSKTMNAWHKCLYT